jgi:hypothetical protein
MAVYTPNLQLVRYNGETPRKLWEIKARNVPILNKGDLVLLNEVTAILMVKKHGFEMVDNSKLSFGENFADENGDDTTQEGDDTTQEGDDTTQEEYKLPLASQIMELSDEEIKAACKYVGLSVSNKKIDTLKSLLLPYLPQE